MPLSPTDRVPNGIFTREDFLRAWYAEPQQPEDAPSTSILVRRVSSASGAHRALRVCIDDRPVGELRGGDTISHPVGPGVHSVRVSNGLVTRSVVVRVEAGQNARIQCGTGVQRPAWLATRFPQVAGWVVWAARE